MVSALKRLKSWLELEAVPGEDFSAAVEILEYLEDFDDNELEVELDQLREMLGETTESIETRDVAALHVGYSDAISEDRYLKTMFGSLAAIP
ncbi:hypothetical protein ACPPVO_30335 [Dactylosporangium sp. McL0621]|uniref:hypothetical protein n=1 Tax=Dactylosporangium sp. McL0621 TaxID=3415678 RepID=UPI003CEEE2CB